MVKIAQVAGFLGSGKTTFLIELVKVLVDRGHKIAIIVNDVGEINVDVKIVEMYGLKAKEISGGCICCQIAGNFANTIAVLQKTFKPDLIIVEPSGVAIPWGLKRAAEYSEEEMEGEVIVHAPVVTLVDALRIDELINSVRRLVETQIREADVVFINKVDSATQEKIDMSVKFSKSINPSAEIMFGSGRSNQGVREVADLIEKRTSPRYDETYEKEMLKREYGGEGLMTELDEDDDLHLEMHRAVDELGKFSLHMKVEFQKGTSAEKAVSFVEELLIKATDACLHHGADLVGHVKAFMMVEDGSTVGFSLIHQNMKVNITKQLTAKTIERAEVIVHVIVHGLWDPEVREQTLEALDEVSRKHHVRFEIIKDFFEVEKSAAHHG